MQRRFPLRKVITTIVAVWFLLFVSLFLAVPWYRTRLPKDMPKNSIWMDAPHVPFGFYHGWWQGCWAEGNSVTKCKLWGGSEVGTVYAGEYVACDAHPVMETELVLEPRSEMSWIPSAKMERLLPVAILQNGRKLVPKLAADECAKL
jgi:hypothetical protein